MNQALIMDSIYVRMGSERNEKIVYEILYISCCTSISLFLLQVETQNETKP